MEPRRAWRLSCTLKYDFRRIRECWHPKGVGELESIHDPLVMPDSLKLSLGFSPPALLPDHWKSREACVLLCVLGLSFPPVEQGSWTIPERTSFCFPSRWKGARTAPVNEKPGEAALGWDCPSEGREGFLRDRQEAQGLVFSLPGARVGPLPPSRSSAHLGWVRQAASSFAPQEARSEGSGHRAASALARNKRLKILGSASRGGGARGPIRN